MKMKIKKLPHFKRVSVKICNMCGSEEITLEDPFYCHGCNRGDGHEAYRTVDNVSKKQIIDKVNEIIAMIAKL